MLQFIKADNQLYNVESLTNVRNEQNRIEISFKAGFARIEGLDLKTFIDKLNEAHKNNLFVLDLDETK